MKDSQQNELKIGDHVMIVATIMEQMPDRPDKPPFLRLSIEGQSVYAFSGELTRIPDDPKPYTPDPSLFAAPVQGSKPEEA